MKPARLPTLLFAFLFPALALADTLWIDVRSPEEYRKDHIQGDPNVPHTEIGAKIAGLAPSKDADIAVYCAAGGRAETARKTLESLGYTHVRNAGGIARVREERGLE